MGSNAAALRAALAPYEEPRLGRSLLGLLTSVVPYLALSVAMYLAVDVSYLLTLAIAAPAGGFLVRTYMVFHDCAHGSFMRSQRANAWLGRFLGLVVFRAFARWRSMHAGHHATVGNLDRRGIGDLWTLTVAEYRALSWRRRLWYRVSRSPLYLFGIRPIYQFMLLPRLRKRGAPRRVRRSIMGTNVALTVVLGGLAWLIGWRELLLVLLPTAWIAGAAGIWLFYVQHQFEDTYWQRGDDWSYGEAALDGSSYLKLPKVLAFFTANIGVHHVHHISPRIPNYNLQRAHDENPIFHDVRTLSLRDALRTHRLKLWDETRGALVPFSALQLEGHESSA